MYQGIFPSVSVACVSRHFSLCFRGMCIKAMPLFPWHVYQDIALIHMPRKQRENTGNTMHKPHVFVRMNEVLCSNNLNARTDNNYVIKSNDVLLQRMRTILPNLLRLGLKVFR